MLGKEDALTAGILRRLFRNRFLLRSKNEVWFQILIEQQDKVRAVLNKMAADLELDSTWGIAYIKTLSLEVEEQLEYQLGSNKTLSRYSSLIIYFLRLRRLSFYRNPDSDVPLVKREELKAFLEDFNFHLESSKFEREFNRSLNEVMDLQVLTRSGSNDFFEITPVCDVILPADEMAAFRTRFEEYFKVLGRGVKSESSEQEEVE